MKDKHVVICTKFVFNAILHHVDMSWIISSNKKMKYELDKNNHQDLLNKGSWFNTSIYLKFHGSMFEDFITHAKINRCNLMCFLVYEDGESSIVDWSIPKNAKTKALKALGSTLNFINVWLKLFVEN